MNVFSLRDARRPVATCGVRNAASAPERDVPLATLRRHDVTSSGRHVRAQRHLSSRANSQGEAIHTNTHPPVTWCTRDASSVNNAVDVNARCVIACDATPIRSQRMTHSA